MLLLFCSFSFSTASAADGSFGVAVELPERMRGATTSDIHLQEPDFFTLLAETDVNVIRVGFSMDGGLANTNVPTAQNPLLPYTNHLAILDRALPLARAGGINIILAAAETYGYRYDILRPGTSAADLATYRTNLVNFWVAMAQRYLDEPAIVAYDILNEPVIYNDEGTERWYNNVLPAVAEAIRNVNTNVWLVVECGEWGMPSGMAKMPLLTNITRVIYSIHPYLPHSYCFQDAADYVDYSATYPGTNAPFLDPPFSYWDKETLRAAMSPAINFSQTNANIRMLVGEFGAMRWAPGADQWLADCIALFEEYGWDWCNHSIGGWNGWNVSYPVIRGPEESSKAADGGDRGARWQVMNKGWSLNRLNQTPEK